MTDDKIEQLQQQRNLEPQFALPPNRAAFRAAASDGEIVTEFVNPPIPIRVHDWIAYRKGYEEDQVYGWGRTEAEALAALRDREAEDEIGERWDGQS